MILKVKVIPNASKDEIVGFADEELKVKLRVPPLEGRANRALIDLLADEFNLKKSKVRIVSGLKARHKQVEILGVEKEDIEKRKNGRTKERKN